MYNPFKCYFVLILLFSAGMLLVSLIPNEMLEPQYSKSIDQLDKEDPYPNLLFNSDAALLDNFMDRLMVSSCWIPDSYDHVWEAAFDNNGYPRYWNGYLMTLRPVLSQFSYQQIRYLNMFLLLLLFCFCFSGIFNRLGVVHALGFGISMTACFLVFVGESLQYFSVFLITLIVTNLLLYKPGLRSRSGSLILFFAAGMVTNFFDMLTAPLLTLGIPLIVLFGIFCDPLSEGKSSDLRSGLVLIFSAALSWAVGYALCWASKWAIGSIVLGKNVFQDAFVTAKFRIGGNEAYPLSRLTMFKLNFETYFFAKGHKPAAILAVLLAGCWIRLLRARTEFRPVPFVLIVLIGIMPYAWYFVFANHSQLHYFYTYRIQAITLYALFAALGSGFRMGEKNDAGAVP